MVMPVQYFKGTKWYSHRIEIHLIFFSAEDLT